MSVLVFDLDGTLVSSGEDLVATTNAVLTSAGYAAAPADQLIKLAGHGAKALLRGGLDASATPWTDDLIEPLFHQFLDHYEIHMTDQTRPYPGAVSALSKLQEQGWRLAVCTNKSERLTHPLLDRLDLSRFFSSVVAGDTFVVSKPKAEPVLGAISRAGGKSEGSIMIGDTATDINAARAAGIPVIAVDFGYTPVPVTELAPDRIISHFDELAGAVAELSADVA